jgi:hypothetical protein
MIAESLDESSDPVRRRIIAVELFALIGMIRP